MGAASQLLSSISTEAKQKMMYLTEQEKIISGKKKKSFDSEKSKICSLGDSHSFIHSFIRLFTYSLNIY